MLDHDMDLGRDSDMTVSDDRANSASPKGRSKNTRGKSRRKNPPENGLNTLCRLMDDILTQAIADHNRQPGTVSKLTDAIKPLATAWQELPAGNWLTAVYGLRPLEQAIMAVLLALQLDPTYKTALVYLQDNTSAQRPTLALVLRLVGMTRATMFEEIPTLQNGPLFEHRLAELDDQDRTQMSPTTRWISIDRQVLALFVQAVQLDESLAGFCRLSRPTQALSASGLDQGACQAVQHAVDQWQATRQHFLVHLQGPLPSSSLRAAAAMAQAMNAPLLSADLSALHPTSNITQKLFRLCREASWRGALLHCHGMDSMDASEANAMTTKLIAILGRTPVPCVYSSGRPWPEETRAPGGILRLSVPSPSAPQRAEHWRYATQVIGHPIDPDTARALGIRFRLSLEQIEQAVEDAVATYGGASTALTLHHYALAARAMSGHALEQLARRIRPSATWTDLVVSKDTELQLREISKRVEQRTWLSESWTSEGKPHRLSRERGVTVLFAGPSGTGKTLASEVIAADLCLDLFCVDLAQVVSKYIGETEKNLDRVFEAAETANAVLFFDEADALFGKRSEVKDAHDRYANLEIAYLLQKMEQFEGLAILATNLRQNIDEAFTRRMSFVVPFSLPEVSERRRLWQAHWPAQLRRSPLLDLEELAKNIPLSGGNIRNLVLAAAHFATSEGSVVERRHLFHAMRREYQKMGKSLAPADWARLGMDPTGFGTEPQPEHAA